MSVVSVADPVAPAPMPALVAWKGCYCKGRTKRGRRCNKLLARLAPGSVIEVRCYSCNHLAVYTAKTATHQQTPAATP